MYSANTEECTLILICGFPNWAHTAVVACFVSKACMWLRNSCKCNDATKDRTANLEVMIKRSVEKESLLLPCQTDHCAKKAPTGEHLMMLRIVIYVDLTSLYSFRLIFAPYGVFLVACVPVVISLYSFRPFSFKVFVLRRFSVAVPAR